MGSSNLNASIPSEFDDEVDDALLPSGEIWAYPCKLTSCPDYGKSWLLRSEFLLHLHAQDAHKANATTAAARRAIELEWRYTTDPQLPPRQAPHFRSRADPDEYIWEYGIKDRAGNIINRRGTQKQMEQDLAQLRKS
ncbi:hypothetical protein TrVFT333_011281 [Trichoderma virens FT-333]|nr:hypothetical protein TrVFT333_011281 [Trichoderma virens FT-333]